jgi:hypothetical protein
MHSSTIKTLQMPGLALYDMPYTDQQIDTLISSYGNGSPYVAVISSTRHGPPGSVLIVASAISQSHEKKNNLLRAHNLPQDLSFVHSDY